MNWSALGFLIVACQDQPPSPSQQESGYEIVENRPSPVAKQRGSRIVRTRRASGSKPIKIKSATHKGVPKFKKPKRR